MTRGLTTTIDLGELEELERIAQERDDYVAALRRYRAQVAALQNRPREGVSKAYVDGFEDAGYYIGQAVRDIVTERLVRAEAALNGGAAE